MYTLPLSRRGRALALAALVPFGACPAARAAVTEWNTNANGSYANAANWTNGAPTASDFVVFRRGAGVAYAVNLPGNNLGGFNNYYANFLRVGNNTVTLTQGINAGLTVTSTNSNAAGNPGVIIAELPGETATVNSAIAFAAHSVTLGHSSGTLGTLNVTSGTWALSADDSFAGLVIGRNGRGAVNLTGSGKINIPNSGVALGGAGGALSLSGPNAAVAMGRHLDIGNGTLTIANAAKFTKQLDGGTDVGFLAGTVANLFVQGTGSTFTAAGLNSHLNVGGFGNGTVSVSGGGQMLIGGNLSLGANGTASIVVDGPGSLLSVGGEIAMNNAFASTPPGNATVTITNGGTFLAGGNFFRVSQAGTARLILDGGVLDLQNHAINHPSGLPTASLSDVQFLSGTLKNVGALHRMEWLNKTGSGTLTLPTANTFNVPVRVAGGTLLVAHPDALGQPFLSSLTVVDYAVARLAPGLPAAVDTNLGLAGAENSWQGTIDITNNAVLMFVPPDDRSHYLQRWLNQIASAKAGGTWAGTGIASSTLTPNTSVALADNASLGYTTFRGKPVDADTAILVQALLGDATLDNKVDAFDLNKLAANWQQVGKLWSDGDFTHDGKVDAFDLNALAAHWQFGAASSLDANEFGALALFAQSGAAVPEPASLALLLPALPLLVRARRRR